MSEFINRVTVAVKPLAGSLTVVTPTAKAEKKLPSVERRRRQRKRRLTKILQELH